MKVGRELLEFEDKIDEYFLKCERDELYPDEAGLILHLGLAKDVYEKYRDNLKGRFSGFTRALESARLRRESILVRGIFSADTRSTSGKIFLARQQGNGGLNDKPKDEQKKVTLEVVIGGETAGPFD